jgi:uncharacterized RDD family membrane protein YckC
MNWSSPADLLYSRGDGMGRRIGSYLIDALVINAVIGGLIGVGALLLASPVPAVGIALIVFGYGLSLFIWLILGLMWGSGQTVGMRAMGLRMIAADGQKPGVGRGLLRVLCSIVSAMCFWIGYLAMFWDPEQQTWHDKWSGIWVVRA